MKKIYQTKYGRFSVDTDADRKIAKCLEKTREIQHQDEIEPLETFIDYESAVVDIGAHIGTTVIPFARKARKVIAFEPLHQSVNTLRENIELNNLRNVEVFEVGLSDKNGTLVAEIQNPMNAATSKLSIAPENGKGLLAEVKVFDEITHQNKCDLIKIDVEGMEPAVLMGATKSIKHWRPIIYFELNLYGLRTYGYGISDLSCFFKQHNYRLFLPRHNKLYPVLSLSLATLFVVPRVWLLNKESNVFNVLAIPAEKIKYSYIKAVTFILRLIGELVVRVIRKILV